MLQNTVSQIWSLPDGGSIHLAIVTEKPLAPFAMSLLHSVIAALEAYREALAQGEEPF